MPTPPTECFPTRKRATFRGPTPLKGAETQLECPPTYHRAIHGYHHRVGQGHQSLKNKGPVGSQGHSIPALGLPSLGRVRPCSGIADSSQELRPRYQKQSCYRVSLRATGVPCAKKIRLPSGVHRGVVTRVVGLGGPGLQEGLSSPPGPRPWSKAHCTEGGEAGATEVRLGVRLWGLRSRMVLLPEPLPLCLQLRSLPRPKT